MHVLGDFPLLLPIIPQWSKLLFTGIILRNLWWRAGAVSVFSCWMRMELRVVLFIPLLSHRMFFLKDIIILKYFIIQRVSGLLILRLIFFSFTQQLTGGAIAGATLVFILKTGTFPFFQWVISLGERISWYPLFVLLSLQKIIPLTLIAHFCRRVLEVVSFVGWVTLPLLVLVRKKIKPVVVISSVFMFLAILCSLCSSSFKWKRLMLLYLLTLLPLVRMGDTPVSLKNTLVSCTPLSLLVRWRVVLLRLIGLPPLPGFLIKIEVFNLVLEGGVALASTFLVGRIIITWVYINLWFLLISMSVGISLERVRREVATCSVALPLLRAFLLL